MALSGTLPYFRIPHFWKVQIFENAFPAQNCLTNRFGSCVCQPCPTALKTAHIRIYVLMRRAWRDGCPGSAVLCCRFGLTCAGMRCVCGAGVRRGGAPVRGRVARGACAGTGLRRSCACVELFEGRPACEAVVWSARAAKSQGRGGWMDDGPAEVRWYR